MQFPHCDSRVLHEPGVCEYCDDHPDWQTLRRAWGIAFTGCQPRGSLPECGQVFDFYGTPKICRQAEGHPRGGNLDGHRVVPEWEQLPCPADAARPHGSASDHRRWAGNKPTSATGDPSWPVESTASRIFYGDKGGRRPWPLRERITRRVKQPIEYARRRRQGWVRAGNFWVHRGRH